MSSWVYYDFNISYPAYWPTSEFLNLLSGHKQELIENLDTSIEYYKNLEQKRATKPCNSLIFSCRGDRLISEQLKKEGWNVITVWECQIKSNMQETVDHLVCSISKYHSQIESTHG